MVLDRSGYSIVEEVHRGEQFTAQGPLVKPEKTVGAADDRFRHFELFLENLRGRRQPNTTAETLQDLSVALVKQFPRLQIAGSQPSRFRSASEQERLADLRTIADSGARIVFVGLCCPRQEIWVYENCRELGIPTDDPRPLAEWTDDQLGWPAKSGRGVSGRARAPGAPVGSRLSERTA